MRMWSMFNETLLADYGFANFGVKDTIFGYQMHIRCNTYRGIYLSCIEKLSLTVDGQTVDPEKMVLVLNGKRFLMHQIPDLFDEYWYKQSDGVLMVYEWGGLKPGPHEIKLEMTSVVPFTGYFGSYISDPSEITKTLVLEPETVKTVPVKAQ